MTWDKMLKIRTSGRDDSRADQYRYPYEPTPYSVLERLAASEYIGKRDVLLDYGCGKGRVDFYLSYQTGCHSIGIEYDERIWQTAMDNQNTAVSGRKVQILNVSAEDYVLDSKVTRCYFFNPFSVEILQSVMERIRDTYYEEAREIFLFFYYPSDEYIGWLMQQDDLMFVDEIDCMDLFEGEEERERIMIFELGY